MQVFDTQSVQYVGSNLAPWVVCFGVILIVQCIYPTKFWPFLDAQWQKFHNQILSIKR